MRVVLVGYSGYWGKKIARVAQEVGFEIVAKVDRNNLSEPWPEADAAIIATPPATHFQIAMQAINKGLDVLVEKPMTMCPRQANRLVEAADKRGVVVSVDSTFLHTAAFKFLKGLGQPVISYQSIRLAPPMPQAQIGAGWDLIVHDLSILHGLGCLGNGLENASGTQDGAVATCSLFLPSGGSAFMMASRVWPMKERSITIHMPSGAYLWTLDTLETLKNGIVDDVVLIEDGEPLKNLLVDFQARCEKRELRGITDGLHGAEVVGCLERLFS